MKTIIKLIFFSPLFLLLSCGADCKDVEIEKVEWVTRYEDYSVDTLANYTIEENKVALVEYDTYDKIALTVNIRNTSSFSNKFAIAINYKNWQKTADVKTLDAIEILPDSTYRFFYEWSSSKANKTVDSDFYSNITVLQQLKSIWLKRRIDELKFSTDTINTCEQNLKALQANYLAIKESYEMLKSENVIKSNDTENLKEEQKTTKDTVSVKDRKIKKRD
jgi:hypothetical protein